MIIKRIVSDILVSNMYLISEGNHAIVIDPCRDISCAEDKIVDKILLTHEHYDHISGVNLWKKKYQAPVFCSEKCAKAIQDPRKNLARFTPVICEMQQWTKVDSLPEVETDFRTGAEETYFGEYTMTWQKHEFEFFELPGHSDGGSGIILDKTYFFAGDNIIPGMDTELRFKGGNKKKWEEVTLKKIRQLDGNLLVYPGHFDSIRLEEWRKENGIF